MKVASHSYLVRQSNTLAGALYDEQHTVAEHRLLRYAASRLNPEVAIEKQLCQRITAKDFGEAFGLEPSLRYRQLIEATSSLAKRQIAWQDASGAVEWVQWIVRGRHEKGLGIVEIEFTRLVVEQLMCVQNFISYKLADVATLSKAASFRLHELALLVSPYSKDADRGSRRYLLEDFKMMLGIDKDAYSRWADLTRKVLLPALFEVNHASHKVRVELRAEKRHRCVVSIMVIAHKLDSPGARAIDRLKGRPPIKVVTSPVRSPDEPDQRSLFAALAIGQSKSKTNPKLIARSSVAAGKQAAIN